MYDYGKLLAKNLGYSVTINMLLRACKDMQETFLSEKIEQTTVTYFFTTEQHLYSIHELISVESTFLTLIADIKDTTNDDNVLFLVEKSLVNVIEHELLPCIDRHILTLSIYEQAGTNPKISSFNSFVKEKIMEMRTFYFENYVDNPLFFLGKR